MNDNGVEQSSGEKLKRRRCRTGCLTCRQRKKRCDELFSPVTKRCETCSRLGLSCRVARPRLEVAVQDNVISDQSEKPVSSTSEPTVSTLALESSNNEASSSPLVQTPSENSTDEDLSDHELEIISGESTVASQIAGKIEISFQNADAAHQGLIYPPPVQGILEVEELSHIDYYRKNVISATSIISDEDTGLHQLVARAFNTKHLMSALLAYSMAHRAQASGDISIAESFRQQATTQYGKAIMALRSALSSKDEDFENLISSTLLLAATETTMGGVSDWYSHCIGANQLVRAFAAKINVEYSAYHQFLIRYLMYHDVLGAVTMRQTPILDSSFYKREIMGLASDFTHPMVGAHVRILSLMARICQLQERGVEWKAKPEESSFAIAQIYGEGAEIEQQLACLKLPPPLPLLLCFVAEAYRSSALLYLYQVLEEVEGSALKSRFLEDKCEYRLDSLKQHIARVPLSSAPASALLFPLFIAGTCVKQPEDKEFVRSKLSDLYHAVRFANILSALEALEVFWKSSRSALGWQQCLRDRGWNLALT